MIPEQLLDLGLDRQVVIFTTKRRKRQTLTFEAFLQVSTKEAGRSSYNDLLTCQIHVEPTCLRIRPRQANSNEPS